MSVQSIYDQSVFYVYQLRLETEELPFYIGKGYGNRIDVHFKSHELKQHSYKNNTIKKAQLNGIVILREKLHENLEEFFALDLEISYIAMYGRLNNKTGCLTNLTDGGDGCAGLVVSDDTKKLLSDANKGKMSGENNPFYGMKHKPESLLLMSKASSSKRYTQEHKDRISLLSKGRIFSSETCLKISESKIGIPRTDDTKTKISETKSKFTNEEKLSIKYEYNVNKISQKEIAKKYNVNSSIICRIITGRKKKI